MTLLVIILFSTLVCASWNQLTKDHLSVSRLDIDAAPSPRRNFATWHVNGNVYVFGGNTDAGRSNDIWRFELASNRWISEINPPSSLIPRSGCAFWKNKLLWIYGGRNESSIYHGLNDMWSFNPETQDWKRYINNENPGPRYGSAVWSSNDNLYLYAGKSSKNTILDDLWEFNTKSLSWTELMSTGDLPGPREDSIATNHNNVVYLFGGSDDNSVKVLDINSLVWSSINTEIVPREDHAIWFQYGKLHIFGGQYKSNIYGDLWNYDLDTQQWNDDSSFRPNSRWGFGFCMDNNDQFYLIGGLDENSELHNDLWISTTKSLMSLDQTDAAVAAAIGSFLCFFILLVMFIALFIAIKQKRVINM